jgi:small neutral amino acid transporter SnatA (MarC family)
MIPTSITENRRFLGYFLSGVIISTIMFVGFAKNFYLRTWIGTRPITAMVHVHGLVMTAWLLVFLSQTILVSKGRTDLHRKLGVIGAVLALVVVALGIYTISNSILRHNPDADLRLSALLFVAFDGLSLLLFGGLVIAALTVRRRSQVHKRLMLIALVSLLPPAFGRLVAYFIRVNVTVFEIVLGLMCTTVAVCVMIDTIRHRRLHPALVWSGALVIAVNLLTYLAQKAA